MSGRVVAGYLAANPFKWVFRSYEGPKPTHLQRKDNFMTAISDFPPFQNASADLLRSVFRQHAAGVAVVTANGAAGPAGFTVTSLTSVSAEPPLVSFGISIANSCWPTVSEASYVGVHILGEHQQELAAIFTRSGADRFAAPTDWRNGPKGVPVLNGVLAWLVCRVVARVPAEAQRIVLAEAVLGDPTRPGRPLLYHQGRYNALCG